MKGAEDKGYESVRQALHEKGYLETPLERFFLAGALSHFGGRPRGLIIGAMLSGVMGGLVLGVLLALALVWGSGGLVPVWPDGVLYAALFSPVLGLAVAAAELFAGLVIRRLARTRRGLSPRRAGLIAGVVVGAGLALYVGSWWARSGAPMTPEGVAGLVALALGAGFAGRVVSAASLAQAVSATGRGPRGPAKAALGTAVVALVVTGCAAFVTLALDVGTAGKGSPVEVAPDAARVSVLVGWDGLGGDVAEGLVRLGATPWLASQRGSTPPLALEAGPGEEPVSLWTSVATGCPPEVHGVRHAGLRALRGARAPALGHGLAAGPVELLTRLWPTDQRAVRAGLRDVPALWEVTADARKTAVLGWWGTWPAAEPGRAGGYVVSDNALVAARLGDRLEEAVLPASWGSTRAALWLEAAESAAPAAGDAPGEKVAREALIADLFVLEALGEVLEDPDLGAAFVYLPGLDILRTSWGGAGRDVYETLERVREHAALVDTRLAGILGDLGADLSVSVAGFPGRAGGGRGFVTGLAHAEGVRVSWPARMLGPAWLVSAGYPVDVRMCSEDHEEGLERLLGRAPRIERTRAVPALPSRKLLELEDETLERLRSLGYVE